MKYGILKIYAEEGSLLNIDFILNVTRFTTWLLGVTSCYTLLRPDLKNRVVINALEEEPWNRCLTFYVVDDDQKLCNDYCTAVRRGNSISNFTGRREGGEYHSQ